MEDKHDEVEDIEDVGSGSSDSFIDSDADNQSTSGQDVELPHEEPLSEQEIEELIAEFLEVESKAAEAQEALEKESLSRVESEVREELAQTLHGDDLEAAVKNEMDALTEEWENTLDELETECAHLLEQLDGAGIELPSLYKLIESQAPNGCSTETWKKRAHWVGSQVTNETVESVADAEKYLQIHRPVRRKHGKLLEEGAGGFLQKKIIADQNKESITENGNVDWTSLNNVFHGGVSEDVASFGSKNWASVYLANTPQEAAAMGLNFPGVDEVEEIDDIDGSSSDPFFVAAIANEKELVLSEEQKRNYRKVKEEDDAKVDQKLQAHLKKRRYRKRKQKKLSSDDRLLESNIDDAMPIEDCCFPVVKEKNHENGPHVAENSNYDNDQPISNGNSVILETAVLEDVETKKSKRLNEDEVLNGDCKRSRTIVIESDDGDDVEKDKSSNGISRGSNEKFNCTSCNKVALQVHTHPLLKVIVCEDCKWLIEEKIHAKDPDCSEGFCGWCGHDCELVNCQSCKNLFCTACITRNIGEEFLSKALGSGWQCFCCSPGLLDRLVLEWEKAMESGELIVTSSDSDSEDSDADTGYANGSKRKRKKKIRRIIDDAELGEETRRKIAIEKERQDRLKSLQAQFSNKSRMMSYSDCKGNLPECASVEVLGDATTGYIVNVVREVGEEAVRIPPSISSKLKVHQVAGIRFIWENIIQSIGKVKSGDRGLGCILAHTMGLGKTFQVIAFLYTAMRSIDLGLRTALIVTPVNVLHNWRQEFMKWRPSEMKPLRIFMLEDVSRERRAEYLAKWRSKGGVFLIGYTNFRNLSLGNYGKDRNMAREISCALQDGPDILVCDEAHMIKNTRADTTQALKQVRCQRRIALTGSPLQNNLMEYYCMVDFVREGFLGSREEFRNRFQNPIENGQHTNSTAQDVKIMNQRSHILYEQLKGFVQRMDMSVVKKDLPPKTVFVIAVKLSPLQRKLYKRYLDVHGFAKDKNSNEKMRRSFFAGYQALAQIWNHPGILQLRKDNVTREDTVESFLADDVSSDENVDYNTVFGDKTRNGHDHTHGKNDWWNDLLHENNYKELDYSGKMVLLLDILTMASDIGDKTLVFSQSILTLDLIEFFLSRLPRRGKRGKFWRKGKDWYRIDGRTEGLERQRLVERFNDPENRRVKCTLISTRAGSLGINLHAANRVVIVDGSWNPMYDLQAIYRAWRYGQKKPVFGYRLMAHGTMEEKIYKRQVTKEGLAARVVDRQQVHRTISREEMLHLFEFGDEENPDALSEFLQKDGRPAEQNITLQPGNSLRHKPHFSNGGCSSDKLMEYLLSKHNPRWIANYHEHETLLQENEDEKLTKEEQDMAWEVFRRSLEWEEVQRVSIDQSTFERKPPVSVAPSAPDTRKLYSSTTEHSAPVTSDITTTVHSAPDTSDIATTSKAVQRSLAAQRKCTNLSHLLTLRSQGTKVGCSTVCGECAQEISWSDLNRDGKTPR